MLLRSSFFAIRRATSSSAFLPPKYDKGAGVLNRDRSISAVRFCHCSAPSPRHWSTRWLGSAYTQKNRSMSMRALQGRRCRTASTTGAPKQLSETDKPLNDTGGCTTVAQATRILAIMKIGTFFPLFFMGYDPRACQCWLEPIDHFCAERTAAEEEEQRVLDARRCVRGDEPPAAAVRPLAPLMRCSVWLLAVCLSVGLSRRWRSSKTPWGMRSVVGAMLCVSFSPGSL